jgi:hypothetical protein
MQLRYRLLALSLLALALFAHPARAVPSFAEQTGQPCSACHIGAFGPQLTAFGRQFKLNGYTMSDGADHIPLAAMAQFSFNHTAADQNPKAAPGFRANDNASLDEASLFYAGAITDHVGIFAQALYSGVGHAFAWGDLDLRYADTTTLAGKDLVYGVTFNNEPSVTDLWNTTPAWGFPFARSFLAPTPSGTAVVDGVLDQQVVGLGGYTQWDDLVYLELNLYRSLRQGELTPLGTLDARQLDGNNPYWRVALQHSFGDHYVELGTYGMDAELFPRATQSLGADHALDTAIDGSYQWTFLNDYTLAAYSTYILESRNNDASHLLLGARSSDSLKTFRANASFTVEDTYTANVQRFNTVGTTDGPIFGGSPNSAGWIGELDYTPTGKSESFLPSWLNVKFALQYVDYTRFNGSEDHASDKNTLYLLSWFAVPLGN